MSCGLASHLQAISCRGRAPVIVARITSRISSALQPSKRMVVAKVERNNIVFFEHLFLGVGDMDTAHIFYEEGLGLVYDPSVRSGQKKGVGVSWLNIGDQQVHIDQEESISRTPGPVRLLLPGFDDLQRQLQQVETKLQGTQFKAEFDFQSHHADITDPWGQHFSIAEKPSNSSGNNKGSVEGLLLPCHIGTAKAIAHFYRTMLEAEATEHTDADGQVYANIELGYGTTFTFQEDAGLGPLSTQKAIEAYEGWHCALYIFDYEGTYNRIVQAGINQVDHPYKDKADTLERARQWNQFRFSDIVAVNEAPTDAKVQFKRGQLLYRFGHEIRNLKHRRCPKILLVSQ